MNTFLPWIALGIVLVSSTGLLLHRDWRWGVAFLAAQYICVFLLIQTRWPLSMAASRLVTGWMACAILGIAQVNISRTGTRPQSGPQGQLFRLFIGGVALVASYALALRAAAWLGISLPVAWGGLLMISMGLIHLGITSQVMRVALGLLTVMAGFEILYATVESSALVAALLTVVNLGLAMAGAYLLNAGREEAA